MACESKNVELVAGRDTQGTIMYMAPEMLCLDSVFDERIEAWSLGILLCKILTKKSPFESPSEAAQIKSIVLEDINFTEEIWNTVSIEAQDVIENLLKKNPSERMTLKDAHCHSWIVNETIDQKMIQLEQLS